MVRIQKYIEHILQNEHNVYKEEKKKRKKKKKKKNGGGEGRERVQRTYNYTMNI